MSGTGNGDVRETLVAESLGHFNWFEDRYPRPHEVGILGQAGGWRVYSTDERAYARYDKVHEEEGEALADFLELVRATNHYFALLEQDDDEDSGQQANTPVMRTQLSDGGDLPLAITPRIAGQAITPNQLRRIWPVMIPMNVGELEHMLQQAGIDPMFYSIGEFNDDCACILQADDGMWETFVGQRGQKDDLRRWDNEGDACVFLIGMLWSVISDELHTRPGQ